MPHHIMVGGHAFLVSMSFAIYIKIFIYLYANKDYIRSNEYPICESFNGSCYGNGLEKYSSDSSTVSVLQVHSNSSLPLQIITSPP